MKPMRIAVDAMGGDFAPESPVDGAIQAARVARGRYEIILVGDENLIRREIAKYSVKNLPIHIYHASEVIGMRNRQPRRYAARKILPLLLVRSF